MSATWQIQAAQALSKRATQKELSDDFDAAFELYVEAAKTFIHLAQTLSDASFKASCKAAAGRALERAEQIKKVKRDIRPVAADPFSAVEQTYILDKSSVVNERRFPAWQDTDGQIEGGLLAYQDPDGQPPLAPTQRLESVHWLRPSAVLQTPLRIVDPALQPEDLVQSVVTDCSVVAALSVCLVHQRRFGSKLGVSSLYPQDANGLPVVSSIGKYVVRVFLNGIWRKLRIVIDDTLPFLTSGQLLGVSAGKKQVLWPPLLEKAYMKLMGGYDFPGSNSGTDLHTLIGWIPEHVHIRSAEFRMERTWTRMLQGFSKGQCLVTLGTPMSVNDGLKDNLLPTHDYAVLDMQDDGEQQYITLLDPWDPTKPLQSSPGSGTHSPGAASSTSLRLTWRDACVRFDTIHLSWDTSLFPRSIYIHGLWKPSKTLTGHAHSVSNRVRLCIRSSETCDTEIWVLLARHTGGKHEAHFMSLITILHDESQTTNKVGKPIVHETYTDSLQVLKRFSPPKGDSVVTVVASLEGSDIDVRYTVTVFSHQEVILENRPRRGFYSKAVMGSLSSRSSGGNHTYPTFMMNPQYRLQLRPNTTVEGIQDNLRAPFCFLAKGPKELPLNVKIVWSNGQRVTELIEGDVAADTGPYSYGVAYGEQDLKVGEYTLIVSAFEPRQQGEFELSLCSSRAFELELLPAEGAGMYTKMIRGAWRQDSSGGSPSFGKYHKNPFIKVSVPKPMDIIIRMQLLHVSAAIAINASIFVMDEEGGLGGQVLTSGPYSDAIAGVVIPRSAIAAGNYLLVPSTYTSGVENAFLVFLYSTGGGIDMSWWRH